MSSVPKTSAVTWYDVLGVLPDASQQDIRAAWQARREALAPGLLGGAAPAVLAAADRAVQAVDEAGRVLGGDPAARASYDEAAPAGSAALADSGWPAQTGADAALHLSLTR